MEFLGNKLRHELKYYLHVHDYAALRQVVSTLLTLDSYSIDHNGYGIRSLYFDGLHNHALHDKADGIFSREKYRIRCYNGSDRVINLERKSKFGEYVCKDNAKLTREEYESILSGDYDWMKGHPSELIADFHHALSLRYFRPAVIVDYQREAYVYEPGNVRITFDKYLSAGINTFQLFDPGLVFVEALETPVTIMEIKFDRFLPDLIRSIIRPDAHNRAAISKYLLCREVTIRQHKP
ncbi:polyphosphate polymerase domain-containing protein [Paenibacillus abyssi]|uniref:Molecular chaperone n=1 Tax=Paenibacillus abyssi TaxID=1340531 RepID=A0A917CP60_9BACL|nr:polyphosphate polymerase domain-containing protein [Paenibacillus abyssi]GGF92600.1 molecular chaperone [Paenibacillus abyssi]